MTIKTIGPLYLAQQGKHIGLAKTRREAILEALATMYDAELEALSSKPVTQHEPA